MALGKGNVALLELLDLSAAFDTVEHDVLLRRLEVSFRVCGTPLKWMKSYVCRVYSNCDCQPVKIVDGQAQLRRFPRICVSTFIIHLYTKDISAIRHNSHGLWNHCYADNTQVYFYCKPEEVDSLTQTIFGLHL